MRFITPKTDFAFKKIFAIAFCFVLVTSYFFGCSAPTNQPTTYISPNSIKDITPLKDLKKLTKLFLIRTKVDDINRLQFLTNLTELYIVQNKNILQSGDDSAKPTIDLSKIQHLALLD
jgi:Leucine-rich repeat (LRR) protein